MFFNKVAKHLHKALVLQSECFRAMNSAVEGPQLCKLPLLILQLEPGFSFYKVFGDDAPTTCHGQDVDFVRDCLSANENLRFPRVLAGGCMTSDLKAAAIQSKKEHF